MNDTPSSSAPEPSAADAQRAQSLRRLEQLENFLRSDPSNNALLIDAYETALRCAAWDRALFHLRHGQSLDIDPWGWRLREGDFWLAQGRDGEALAVLAALAQAPSAPPGFDRVVLHNLAFIEFRRGEHAACIERLAPVLERTAGTAPATDTLTATDLALQVLWLRALHHDGQLERAMAWAQQAEAQGALGTQAAGAASLVALDAADFAAAQRWSERSLREAGSSAPPVEALVTQASLALGQRDEKRARSLVSMALERQPSDGRTWSVLGFADLLAGNLAAALVAFGRALEAMPSHIGTWHGQAWARLLQGDLAGARRSFESALALDRNFAESHGGLAVVFAMQKATTEAAEEAEIALRLDAKNLSGRYAQALLSGEIQNAQDLERLAKRLLAGVTAGSVN